MRKWLIRSAAAALAALLLPLASAQATPVEGIVVSSESRWAYGHSAIVTESVLESDDGSRITVHQLGGSHDGIGMRQSHALPVLATGDALAGELRVTRTASGRSVHQLQEVHRLRHAPTGDKNKELHEVVRTENASGTDIYWRSGCALLTVDSAGSQQIAGDSEFTVIDQSISTWREGGSSCSDFTIVNEGRDSVEVGFDGTNVIKFRDDLWCRPATDDDPQECYDQAAAGITTLFFIDDSSSDRDGEILDADIEFNGVQFAFSVSGQTSGNQQCLADLGNTLTHELGHFLGLDHTCWIAGNRLVDEAGNQAPSCTKPNLGEEITEPTMYNFQSCGETKKATLEPDDIDGMCAIYPTGMHPSTCEPADITPKGCCTVAGGHGQTPNRSTALLATLGFLGLFLALRRRRSGATPQP